MLMEHIDKAIGEADKFEERLDSYEEILSHVKETMEKIGGKNAMIKIANNNNIKLKEQLGKIIVSIESKRIKFWVEVKLNLQILSVRIVSAGFPFGATASIAITRFKNSRRP